MRILSILALSVMLALGAYPHSAWAELNQAIQQSFDEGDFVSALDLVEQALEDDRKDQKLILAKGYLLVKLNRLDAAAEYYRATVRALINNPEPGNNLAMVYRMQGKYEQAIELFEQTIEKFPDYAHAYENLGDTYIELAHNQYQAGFDISGQILLKKKIKLSQNFHQIAVETSPKVERKTHQTKAPTQAVTKSSNTPAVATSSAKANDEMAKARTLIISSIDAWLNDWQSMNPERYLSHYSKKFTPSHNASIEQWIERKKQILANAGEIKLKLSDIDIQFAQADTAIVKFTQNYQSKSFQDVSSKTLRLQQDQGRWLILKETSEDR